MSQIRNQMRSRKEKGAKANEAQTEKWQAYQKLHDQTKKVASCFHTFFTAKKELCACQSERTTTACHSPWSTSKTSTKPASLKSRSACFLIPGKREESLHGQDRYIIPRAMPCKHSVLSSFVGIGTAFCRMNLQKLPMPIAANSLRFASPPNHRQHLAKRLPRRMEINSKVRPV